MKELSGAPLTYIKLVLTAVLWGGTFIAGKIIAGNVGHFSAAFLRFAVASAFLTCMLRKSDGGLRIPDKKHLIPLVLLGMTGVFAYNGFFFSGLKRIDAGRAALIIACNPVFICLFSSLLFKEKLSPRKILGIVTSLSGAVTVITRGDFSEILGNSLGTGEFFIFCCVLSWVSYTLIGKTVMDSLTPLAAVTWSSIIGTLFLLVPAVLEGVFRKMPTYAPSEWMSLFYLGFFGTVLGFRWYYEGVKAIGPVKAGLFINFVPVAAVLMAFFLLGEPLSSSLVVGGLLVSFGVFLTNAPSSRDSSPAAAVHPEEENRAGDYHGDAQDLSHT